MNAEQTFRAKAPGIMAQLLRDFPITPLDAAAILGNLGHESAGLTDLTEDNPTVAGSRGGYGWAQWTGARRRAYEAYCKRTGKDPASDAANYAYLFVELKGIEGGEGGAIRKLVAANGLENKVVAFEKAFLRAGIKHYPARQKWAAVAIDAWRAKSGEGVPIPAPTIPPPPNRTTDTKTSSAGVGPIAVAAAILVAIVGAILKHFGVFP